MRIATLAVGWLLAVMAGPTSAALLVDYSPDTTGAQVLCCIGQDTHVMYLQRFQLQQPSRLTGFVYYNEDTNHNPDVGDQIQVSITQGPFVAGELVPSLVNAYPLITSNTFEGASEGDYSYSSIYGFTGMFAPLPDIELAAGTYWIGFKSSTGFALLTGTNAPTTGNLPSLVAGRCCGVLPYEGTMAMRLYGDPLTPIPTPSAALLMLTGLLPAYLAGVKRKARKMPNKFA